MGIIQSAKGGLKRMFGLREISENYTFVKNYSKEVITTELNAKSTGKHAIETDPAKLAITYQVFKKLFLSYLLIAIVALIYAGYNFLHAYHIAGLLSICFSIMCLSLSFRYNFWMFQIKSGVLGCSFKDWYQATLGKGV
ncbi:MAG: hypothetical protein Q7V63_03560 [Gammaproteobacteria bacterium]|nr:hypothetical protein [Gammaproteobacteria bacterium]